MRFITRSIRHTCPYRAQDVPLAGCYVNSQDPKDTYCYGCPHVDQLRTTYGLRTYLRMPVTKSSSAVSLRYVYVPSDLDGKHWLVVDLDTSERMSLGTYAALRVTQGCTMWSHVADCDSLPGAPTEYETDRKKRSAAAAAHLSRGRRRI